MDWYETVAAESGMLRLTAKELYGADRLCNNLTFPEVGFKRTAKGEHLNNGRGTKENGPATLPSATSLKTFSRPASK